MLFHPIIDKQVTQHCAQLRTLGDTTLVTGLKPYSVLLITNLWDLPFKQFSIHPTIHSSNPLSLSLPMRIL